MLFERISSQRDPVIATEARQHSRQESGATAGLLACLAVFDERRAFGDLGYSCMLDYCQRDLALSEDVAKKYLRAARIARARPVLFDMLADRRLSVSAVLTLGPWLESGGHDDLIAAAVGRSREEIEWLIAERCPQPEMLALEVDAGPATTSEASLQASLEGAPGPACPSTASKSSYSVVPLPVAAATVKPLSADHVALTVTMTRATREKIRRAQELLGHAVAPEAIAEVLDRALDQLIVALEKRKHGLHRKPRGVRAKVSHRARHIPADVRAAVYRRDGGACTFVSDDGQRCGSRHALQYDHIVAVADGGASTIENLRLLCPAHNQLEAERRFGKQTIADKRAASRSERVQAQEKKEQLKAPHEDDVRAALTELGYNRAKVSIGLSAAATLPAEADTETRVKLALRALTQGLARKESPGACERVVT
ncbi:MAG: HNH endonuclease [Candidatus Eisenbacteria bacterium]